METRTCEHCGAAFKPTHPRRANRFCSSACYRAHGSRGPRKETILGRRYTLRPGHPLAPKSGLIPVARLVLYERIGPGPHNCAWCGVEIDWKRGLVEGALLADHLNHDGDDNRPENLVPACNRCNAHRTRKGDRRRITEEDVVFVRPDGRRERGIEVACIVCSAPFITTVNTRRIGRGTTCSRSCAAKLGALRRSGHDPRL